MVSRRPRRLAAPAAVAAAVVAAVAALLAARDAGAVMTRPYPTEAPARTYRPVTDAPVVPGKGPTEAPAVPVKPTYAPLEPPTKSPTKSPVSNERCTLRTCGKQLPSGCYCDEQCDLSGDCCPGACQVCGACPRPTKAPTDSPTHNPTANPTAYPTVNPTRRPTASPTTSPTPSPTERPPPTPAPVEPPTDAPIVPVGPVAPTREPLPAAPTRPAPPTEAPTRRPTANPTAAPTAAPTKSPTVPPTYSPAVNPCGGKSPGKYPAMFTIDKETGDFSHPTVQYKPPPNASLPELKPCDNKFRPNGVEWGEPATAFGVIFDIRSSFCTGPKFFPKNNVDVQCTADCDAPRTQIKLASSFSYANSWVDPPYLYTVIASYGVNIEPPPYGVPDGNVVVDVPIKLLSTTNDPNQWPNNGTCYSAPGNLEDGLPPAPPLEELIPPEELCPDGAAPGSDGCKKLCPDKVSIINKTPTIIKMPGNGIEFALKPFFKVNKLIGEGTLETEGGKTDTNHFWAPEGKETKVEVWAELVPVECLPPDTPTKAPVAELIPAPLP